MTSKTCRKCATSLRVAHILVLVRCTKISATLRKNPRLEFAAIAVFQYFTTRTIRRSLYRRPAKVFIRVASGAQCSARRKLRAKKKEICKRQNYCLLFYCAARAAYKRLPPLFIELAREWPPSTLENGRPGRLSPSFLCALRYSCLVIRMKIPDLWPKRPVRRCTLAYCSFRLFDFAAPRGKYLPVPFSRSVHRRIALRGPRCFTSEVSALCWGVSKNVGSDGEICASGREIQSLHNQKFEFCFNVLRIPG